MLFYAVTANDPAGVERALKEGANVNYCVEAGANSVLIEAAYSVGSLDIVRLLVRNGADIDFRNGAGGAHASALMCAAYKGYYDIVKFLLQSGANPDFKTATGGHTAESYAIDQGYPEIAALIKRASSRDEVCMSRDLDEYKLDEIFNFASMERISLLRKDTGDVVAMTREQFSAIENSPDLEKAFDLYKKRGGKKNENEVFPNRMFKPPKGL